jgi:nucleoside-diphosphate kinase
MPVGAESLCVGGGREGARIAGRAWRVFPKQDAVEAVGARWGVAALLFGRQTLTQPREAEQEGAAMAIERTFSIIKPDATRRNLTGRINAVLEAAGLRIIAQKRLHMTLAQAETFYGVHAARPFFRDLVTFMTMGPVVVQVLECENAIAKYRDVMGATNPANAAEGTIRKLFAESIEANSVHGSDSAENAATEIAYFFSGTEIVG